MTELTKAQIKSLLRPRWDAHLNETVELMYGLAKAAPVALPQFQVIHTTPAPSITNPLDWLSKAHLTLPVDKTGGVTGSAMQIEPADLVARKIPDFAKKFVQFLPTSVLLTCPFDGAKTSSKTKSCRNEFRSKQEFSTAKYFGIEVEYVLRKTGKDPVEGMLCYLQQFHAGDFPIDKIGVVKKADGNFKLIAKVKHEAKEGAADKTYDILPNLVYDVPFVIRSEWRPDMTGAVLDIHANGIGASILMQYPVIEGVYPKFGAYPQHVENGGDFAIAVEVLGTKWLA